MAASELPRFLCYISGDPVWVRDAAIVTTKQGILDFIETQWIGTSPEANDVGEHADWDWILEDLAVRPDHWGDGLSTVRWDFEGGYLTVELLSEWQENWEWA